MSFLEIFAPGLRHLREERARQRHDAAEPRRSDPPFEIDLEAGTARIILPAADPSSSDRTRFNTLGGGAEHDPARVDPELEDPELGDPEPGDPSVTGR